ncbi:MAG: M6 family metalloprotease domain-containing protein [Paludibacteraceae bacterium]|nr:M6 family metalloprotease domain-containing protein [Paludibacteraceae bacterium]
MEAEKRVNSEKLILSLVGLVVISVMATAAPARREGRVAVMENGEATTVYLHGDEFFHWETNAEGNWVERQADGKYAKVPALSNEEINRQRRLSPIYRAQQEMTANAAATASKPARGVVILVNFSNISFTTNTDNIRDAIGLEGYTNTAVGAIGSAHDYFKAASNGKYAPEFDVWGPYTLSNTSGYYGGSSGTDLGYLMANEACSLAYADGKSFAPYSTANYEVDYVYIIYAGYDGAQNGANTVWAHAYDVSYHVNRQGRTYGGYSIGKYACSSELMGNTGNNQNGIGTFCHEFSHILGLPDYYVTGYGTKSNPNYDLTNGYWSLMDYGCYNNNGWTPCLYSAYDRYFMGWETPVLLNAACNDTVPINGSGDGSTRMITPTGKMALYTYADSVWYIENRQNQGWDAYLPGHGLIITRVRYNSSVWSENVVNNSTPMLYDIKEAGGKLSYFGDPSDPYPGTMNVTTYTPTGNYTMSEINELSDGRVAFKFMGGMEPTAIEDCRLKNEDRRIKIVDGMVVIEREGRRYNILGKML